MLGGLCFNPYEGVRGFGALSLKLPENPTERFNPYEGVRGFGASLGLKPARRIILVSIPMKGLEVLVPQVCPRRQGTGRVSIPMKGLEVLVRKHAQTRAVN